MPPVWADLHACAGSGEAQGEGLLSLAESWQIGSTPPKLYFSLKGSTTPNHLFLTVLTIFQLKKK
jgi:hypothetical protein